MKHVPWIPQVNETCSLDTSGDHLIHLDSPSLSSELQDSSSVESIEVEFVPDFEEPLDNNNLTPTDVFSEQCDYDLFLLNQEIDAPSDNLNHQDSHACNKLGQDDTFLIHATTLSHIFSQPQFIAQHNCEHLRPTDTLSTAPAFIQASSEHILNTVCAHNPMTTQCNQSQYLTLLNKICAHYASASQFDQAKRSNSLTFPCPPDSGGYVLKKSAARLRSCISQ